MKCKNHDEREASLTCTLCNGPVCGDCAVELGKNIYCRQCLEELVSEKDNPLIQVPKKRSWLFAILLSIVPGTGHMYLGLMKKGVSIMSLLFTLIFAVVLFAETASWIAGLIPTLSFLFISYSVFDCLSLTPRVNAGEDLRNEGIYELRLLKEFIQHRSGLFSIILLIAGGVGIVNIFSKLIGEIIFNLLGVHFSLTAFLIPVVLVIMGLYLLKEGKRDRF